VNGMRPGVGAGGPCGAGSRGGGHVVDEQQRPGFLADQIRGLAAQRPARPADGPLEMKERDFDLPSFRVQDGVCRGPGKPRDPGAWSVPASGSFSSSRCGSSR